MVYWVLGLTAASRRRPAAWLGARVLAVGPTLFGSIAGVWTGKESEVEVRDSTDRAVDAIVR